MAEKIARILLMSDSHNMVVNPWEQKGQTDKGMAGWIVEFFIAIWKLFNHHFFLKALEKAKKMGRFDFFIYCGDLAETVYNERGIIISKDVERVKEFKRELESAVNIPKENIRYLTDDHSIGYRLPLSCDPEGGISWRSIDNFQSIFGPLFSGMTIGKFELLFLSSALFVQPSDHLIGDEKKYVDKLRQDQYNFFWDYFSDKKNDKQMMLFLHDPDALEKIDAQIINYYVLRNRRYRVFCGHMHAEDSLKKYENLGKIANAQSVKEKILRAIFNYFDKGKKVIAWAMGNLERVRIFKKYDLQVVPSTAGMMGRGGGFLVLNLFDDGSFEVEKHKV